mgnify:CR=1 FL=1
MSFEKWIVINRFLYHMILILPKIVYGISVSLYFTLLYEARKSNLNYELVT